MDILDAAFAYLQSSTEPVHNKALTEHLFSLGLIEDADKPGQTLVYRMILNEVNRLGSASRFQRGARACWIATANYDPSVHVHKKNVTKKTDERKYERKAGHIAEEDRKCGNCKFMSFYGPHFYYQQSAHCENEEKSGKPYVQPLLAACPYWRQRSADQIAADAREKADDDLIVKYGPGEKKKKKERVVVRGGRKR